MAGTIYIQLMGFGAEVSVGEIDDATYKFWNENEEKYEEVQVPETKKIVKHKSILSDAEIKQYKSKLHGKLSEKK